MPSENLIMTLGKVIVAAAWADGEITNDEINSLKDLLFYLPRTGNGVDGRLTEQEWAELDIYIDSPVGAEERARLIADLQAAVQSEEDKALVLATLEDLVEADGTVSAEERAAIEEIQHALNDVGTGFLGFLSGLVGGAMNRRSAAVVNAPNREDYLEEFIKNKVYYSVHRQLEAEGKTLNVTDDELRKLALAGGLMARVAHADRTVTVEERDMMKQLLQAAWPISPEAATLVVEIAVSEVNQNLDYFRLSRQLAKVTHINERVAFIDALQKIARADGTVTPEESAEVWSIAQSLSVTQAHLAKYRNEETGQ
ncbi:MAG: TerB family tellurite resistance protein [Anaerolineae bacterium]|nr:TerB family tellurite resistance protein [Anaerolineae bacterium]